MNCSHLLIPVLLGLLVGCTQKLNDRPTLGGAYLSPTFRLNISTPTPLDRPSEDLFASTPKPRSGWAPTQYLAPVDGVVHWPMLRILAPLKRTDPPRVYGRYPTLADALNPQTTAWIEDLLMTIDEYGRSFLGTPYAIGYFTLTGKLTEPLISPQPWKRTETANTWSSGYPTAAPAPKEPTMSDANPPNWPFNPALEISVPDAAALHEAPDQTDFLLIDIREPHELEISSIEGALHIPMGEIAARINELDVDEDTTIAVLCRTGRRSLDVAIYLQKQGLDGARSVAGGINWWSLKIDPTIERY